MQYLLNQLRFVEMRQLIIIVVNITISIIEEIPNTVFDLITAPALITAPPDFLLYFHLLSPT